jgi:AcrR family transcriptional regulator
MGTQLLRTRLREATWTAIVDAAEEVAADEGVRDASIQAIADRAGTAVGTIYNYFRDRDGIFAALFARRREELYSAIDASARRHARAPFERQLEVFVRTVFEYFDGRRSFVRICLESERPPVVRGDDGRRRPAMQQLQERAERIVRIGIRERRVKDDGARLLAPFLVSLIRATLVARNIDDRPFAPETERVVSFFLRGAAPT